MRHPLRSTIPPAPQPCDRDFADTRVPANCFCNSGELCGACIDRLDREEAADAEYNARVEAYDRGDQRAYVSFFGEGA